MFIKAGTSFSTLISSNLVNASMVCSGRFLIKTEAYLSITWFLVYLSGILSTFSRAFLYSCLLI